MDGETADRSHWALRLHEFDGHRHVRARRTPENTLHLVAVFGGWPGALVAQDLFRHKSSKASFQVVFWLTVVVNCGALTWILKGNGHLL